jgi:hypothetical protein
VVTEDQQLVTQTQVDARGLYVALVPRVDDQASGFDLFLDAVVTEDGREGPPMLR